ncbi:MAG: hypothetical protein ACRDI2_09240 [Chloroflexota bacterium]
MAVGGETFTIKRSGVTLRRDWAWVMDFRDGRITRILGIEDLSGLEEVIAAAYPARGREGQPVAGG